MIWNVVWLILIFLGVTLAVEGLGAFVSGLRKTDLVIVLLANIATNPLVQIFALWINMNSSRTVYIISIIVIEVSVIVLEGFIYKKTLRNCKLNHYLLSLALNVSSIIVGILVNIILRGII